MSKKYCDIRVLLEDAAVGRWWDNMESRKKGSDKWETLRQNGPYFQEPYKPLPKNVKVLYKGKKVELDTKNIDNKFNVTAEEAATFYALRLEMDVRLEESRESDYIDTKKDKVFKSNFWNDWKAILGKGHIIQNLEDVNFKHVMTWLSENSEAKKEAKKQMSKGEKEAEKEVKEEIKEIYGFAIVDGLRIPVGGYAVQPPGLFIGHGAQPKRGKIKKRILPNDVTINVSKKFIPNCNIHGRKCKWGDAVEKKDVEWLATWKNPVTGGSSSIRLKREASSGTCMDDYTKFEKARKLNKNIKKIRDAYKKDMKKGKVEAVAAHLLDVMPIRPGSEKDTSKEADTVGLTTLKCANVKILKDNEVQFSFSGKSSIKFERNVKIDPSAYNYIKKICSGSQKSLFPKMKPSDLNAYLGSLLSGLTSKVFRTWTASKMMYEGLENLNMSKDDPVVSKTVGFDMINMEAALALNHKTMTNQKTKAAQVKKLKDKRVELKAKKKAAKTEKQKESAEKALAENEFKTTIAEENVSLSTSRVNYIDPRIVVSWSKQTQTPIEKIYNKTQQGKFIWAMETPSDWKF